MFTVWVVLASATARAGEASYLSSVLHRVTNAPGALALATNLIMSAAPSEHRRGMLLLKETADGGYVPAMWQAVHLAFLNRELLGPEQYWLDRAAAAGSLPAVQGKALGYMERGKYVEAEPWLRRAVQLGDTNRYADLGEVMASRQQWQAAAEMFIKGRSYGRAAFAALHLSNDVEAYKWWVLERDYGTMPLPALGRGPDFERVPTVQRAQAEERARAYAAANHLVRRPAKHTKGAKAGGKS